MTTTTNDRLARLLDAPFLPRLVPQLPPETLHQLIEHCGLEACGELLTSATPAQLTSLADLDLWRHPQPGQDEQFDVDRFGEWLDVLVDTGDLVAARTVAALDQHLVILGLSRYLRVFDPGTFEPTESSDDEPIDRDDKMNSERSGPVLECEVGGYLVRAGRSDAWDAILSLLNTLQSHHNTFFHAVMQGCRRLSNSTPETDGLDDLLLAPEQHLQDVAVEREQRRSQQGYATPADARAFLQMARKPRKTANPIATAYFRAAGEEADAIPERPSAGALPSAADISARGDDDLPSTMEGVIELLTEAGVMPERPRALLAAGEEDPRAARLPLLRPLMEFALHHDELAYLTRSRELAFLANILLAGCSVQSRPFTPQEAADAAACVCNLGLESGFVGAPPDTFLVNHDLVAAFEQGWAVLHRDVSLFVADQLVATLDGLECADPDTRRGLRTLRRTLVKQRKAGTPWLAREAADVLQMLDLTACTSVLGLLDECPIVPATLTAVLEHRTTSVSPTEFQFISSAAQIGDIRVFVGMLPALLSA